VINQIFISTEVTETAWCLYQHCQFSTNWTIGGSNQNILWGLH